MKKVWVGLSLGCAATGIIGVLIDMMNGNSFWNDSAYILFFFSLPAAFFGWLAWLWRIKSPIRRAAEQAENVTEAIKQSNTEYKKMSKALKWRAWKYRICGLLIAAFGIWI